MRKKTVVVLGGTVLSAVLCAQTRAQLPHDPYPRLAGTFPTQGPTAQPPQQGPVFVPPVTQPAVPLITPQMTSTPVESRSQRLELIARDADRHTQKAFELASRGAHYSARAEFVQALRLVAQGLDSDRQCRAYSESLRAGLRALEEVDDFIPTGSQLESDLPLREIIARHQTTVLKKYLPSSTSNQASAPEDRPGRTSDSLWAGPELPTPMEAVGAYLGHAQEQLSIAVGGEVAGSMALHGLGKLYATRQGSELDISVSRAIVCFKASTTVCPQNYLAQNDLGVLLARSGRMNDACQVLEESMRISPRPETMGNLAATYQAQGKTGPARQLREQLASYRPGSSAPGTPIPAVDWVTPEQFSESYAKTPDARQVPPVQAPKNPQPDQPTTKQADRTWPWNWTKR